MDIINKIMIPLKVAIFDEVRTHHTKSVDFSNEQLNQLLFHHRDGLRLSYTGFIILKNIFTVYSFDLPIDTKSKHRRGMDKMEYPYFFTKSRLILFSEMDAAVIKLHGGLEGFLEMCSNIDT